MSDEMSAVDSHVILVTTSPRTPEKMIPEIKLLCDNFSGKKWKHETQVEFMELLRKENFFHGTGTKDPAFSARDRINRAPQALGFVTLRPTIQLTPAGKLLLESKRKEEVFLKQLLKFQLPSAYHTNKKGYPEFRVRPYLELFRLIRYFGTLQFDELMMFGLQLTRYDKFDSVCKMIEDYRVAKAAHKGSYKEFRGQYFEKVVSELYADQIAAGDTKTRETKDDSPEAFKKRKKSNMRDYADACVRYLRATGMVNISHAGRSLSIVDEKIEEVNYFLDYSDHIPRSVENRKEYLAYLTDSELPALLTDDRELLIKRFKEEFPNISIKAGMPTEHLKDLFNTNIEIRRAQLLDKEVHEIKDGKKYDDIKTVFKSIKNKDLYDIPLMLEWNVWRAMTMIDGGDIHANLKFDDYGKPLSTALGNMSDIVCDYGDFDLTVEVTTATGQRQYEMEGEPVMRHLGKQKMATGKETYCLFIAPQINPTTIAHFYSLHLMNLKQYGGKLTIIPLDYAVFEKMLDDSYKASYTPLPAHVKSLFLFSIETAKGASDEEEWYEAVKQKALHWLEA